MRKATEKGQWVALPFDRGDVVECREDGRRPWRGTVHAIEANNYHSNELSVVYVVIPDGHRTNRPDFQRRRRYVAPDHLHLVP